jgi:hypothetical protein
MLLYRQANVSTAAGNSYHQNGCHKKRFLPVFAAAAHALSRRVIRSAH